MKRIIQFAVVLVAALLAGLPTAEALMCPLRASTALAGCPMGMSKTSAKCPFAQGMTANECLRDCCNCGLPRLVGPIAVQAKQKQGVPAQFVAMAALSADAERAAATAPDGPTHPSSPPRYILHRVFRI